MNSINKDKDYQDNTEANNFVFVDRYMLNKKEWNKKLEEVKKSNDTIKFEDKIDSLYWRGGPASDNNTVYSKYGMYRPKEIFA